VKYMSMVVVGGGLSALGAAGWPMVALATAVVLAAVAALCWVLSDTGRTRRAVALISALRRS
jgi:hypothetical protein